MYPRKIVFVLLIILCLTQLAQAGGQTTLSPNGGHDNQRQISEALKNGDVYLEPGVYEVDDTIILPPNRALRGDSNAIIRVWSGSSQWFVGLKGVISCGDVVAHDNVIDGFQMDGNIGSLPKGYADSRADTSHDCMKLIILHGYSNQFASNITISNMKLYNSFSDGAYILFGDHIICSDNFISNCQHEGLYFSCLKNSAMYRNKIAAITSDAARLDNCVNCLVADNLFFSYNGESYGAFKHGNAGLQIANAGSSHGYNAANKPQKTDRVEVRNNTFADPGRQAIWLHNYDGSVFVHDNSFINAAGLETQGIPVGDISSQISVDNPPSVELSENIFNLIDDLMNRDYTNSGTTTQNGDSISYSVQTYEKGKIVGGLAIVGFKNTIILDNHTYISSANDALVKTEVVSIGSYDPMIKQSNVEKTVTTDIKNGIATATLNVKMTYYTVKNGSNGKASFVSHSTTATFTTSAKAPEILSRNLNVSGTVDDYQQKSNPNTRVFVPYDAATQSIEYVYDGQSETHTFMLGERLTDSNGVEYTSYSRVNQWDGGLNHMSDSCIIHDSHFDPAKLKVVYRTPFENVTVADLKITEHNADAGKWQVPELGFILRTFFMLWIGYRLMKLIFS